MRIQKIEIREIAVPYGPNGFQPSWLPHVTQFTYPTTVLRLKTCDGTTGISATNCFGNEVAEFIESCAPALLGRKIDSRKTLETCWRNILNRARASGPSSMIQTVVREALLGETDRNVDWRAVIDELFQRPAKIPLFLKRNIELEHRPWCINVALWDLLAKAKNVPISTLLGNVQSSIPIYISTGERIHPNLFPFIRRWQKNGTSSFKLRIRGLNHLSKECNLIKALQNHVSGSLELGVDANQAWSVLPPYWGRREAMNCLQNLEHLGVSWLEEPLGGNDLRGVKSLSNASAIQIFGGELQPYSSGSPDLIDAYDVVNPDVPMCTGFSEGIRIARLAKKKNKQYTPHTWGLGTSLAAGLQMACSVEPCPKLEFPCDPAWPVKYRDCILEQPLLPENGRLHLPEQPGLGVDLDMNTIESYTVNRLVIDER